MIKTADGYRLQAGEKAFNYYDMYVGTIGDIDSEGWFDFQGDDGQRAILNGERICSIESAERKGWM